MTCGRQHTNSVVVSTNNSLYEFSRSTVRMSRTPRRPLQSATRPSPSPVLLRAVRDMLTEALRFHLAFHRLVTTGRREELRIRLRAHLRAGMRHNDTGDRASSPSSGASGQSESASEERESPGPQDGDPSESTSSDATDSGERPRLPSRRQRNVHCTAARSRSMTVTRWRQRARDDGHSRSHAGNHRCSGGRSCSSQRLHPVRGLRYQRQHHQSPSPSTSTASSFHSPGRTSMASSSPSSGGAAFHLVRCLQEDTEGGTKRRKRTAKEYSKRHEHRIGADSCAASLACLESEGLTPFK